LTGSARSSSGADVPEPPGALQPARLGGGRLARVVL
jgi:hypothetical protein